MRHSFRPLSVVQVDPDSLEVIKVAAESKTSATSFERLRFRRRSGVFIIGPLFACRGMCAKAVDTQLTSDKDFGDGLLVLAAFKVGTCVHAVLPGPTGRSEQLIEPIGVGTLVRIRDHLAPRFSVLAGVGYAPFNHTGIKGDFEVRANLLHLV